MWPVPLPAVNLFLARLSASFAAAARFLDSVGPTKPFAVFIGIYLLAKYKD